MHIPFEDRQAIQMRANAANQHMVTIKHQMLWGNGRGEETIAFFDIGSRFFGGDMLKHHFQLRVLLTQWLHHRFNKARFTIENIDRGGGHFTVDQQRHTDLLHTLQHGGDAGDIGHAVAGVSGRMCRIQLGGGKHAFGEAFFHFIRIQ